MREWTVDTELLAQLVEEMSIVASEQRRKKPREIPRPKHVRGGGSQKQGVKAAIDMLKATSRRVYRPG